MESSLAGEQQRILFDHCATREFAYTWAPDRNACPQSLRRFRVRIATHRLSGPSTIRFHSTGRTAGSHVEPCLCQWHVHGRQPRSLSDQPVGDSCERTFISDLRQRE